MAFSQSSCFHACHCARRQPKRAQLFLPRSRVASPAAHPRGGPEWLLPLPRRGHTVGARKRSSALRGQSRLERTSTVVGQSNASIMDIPAPHLHAEAIGTAQSL